MKGKIFGGMLVAAMLSLGISNSVFADPGCHGPRARGGFYVSINGGLGNVAFGSGGYAPAYYRPVPPPPPPPPPVVVPVQVYRGHHYRRPACNGGYGAAYYNNGNCNNGYNNGCGQGYGYNQPAGYYNGGYNQCGR